MKQYSVAQVGCGGRGKIHIRSFMENSDRFRYVGLCDLDEAKMKEAAEQYGVEAPLYTDADTMLAETRPDVFCFITQPNVRQSMVELGVKYGVRGMALEKPMATSLREARAMTDLCVENDIKAVVSHQQKYLSSFQKLKQIVEAGEIGTIEKIHVGTQAWLSQLGTHFMDYALWANDGKRAEWAVGHVHGKQKLSDSHPSVDFINGTVLLEDGVRIYLECGYLAEQNLPQEKFFTDNRLTVYGSHGYVWCETDGAWAKLTRDSNGEVLSGQDPPWGEQAKMVQIPYLREFADWLDGGERHSCNIEISYHGYEILEGISISAIENTRVDFPLEGTPYPDINAEMRDVLPDVATYEKN